MDGRRVEFLGCRRQRIGEEGLLLGRQRRQLYSCVGLHALAFLLLAKKFGFRYPGRHIHRSLFTARAANCCLLLGTHVQFPGVMFHISWPFAQYESSMQYSERTM